jgi:hypothetical protein
MGGTMPSNQAPRNVGIVCAGRAFGTNASRSISGLPAWRRAESGHAHGFDQTLPAIRSTEPFWTWSLSLQTVVEWPIGNAIEGGNRMDMRRVFAINGAIAARHVSATFKQRYLRFLRRDWRAAHRLRSPDCGTSHSPSSGPPTKHQ